MIKEFLKVIVRHIAGITVRHKMNQTSGVELLCACCFFASLPFFGACTFVHDKFVVSHNLCDSKCDICECEL